MQPEKAYRATYADMWQAALNEHERADDMLREFKRLDDELDPIEPATKARAVKRKALFSGIADLIAWCERHKKLVAQSVAQEKQDQAAKELAEGNNEAAA
jgi:hypothetical protein